MTRLPCHVHLTPVFRAILIAGPTASGKSSLALALAERLDGEIVNADALQVYACWEVLSARPGAEDLNRAPHRLYGHVKAEAPYSVGHWQREVAALLADAERPVIIVGGTGLYFSALTEGLAEVPPIPEEVRAAGDALRLDGGAEALRAALAERDPVTLAGLDANNPARLQRAWEVIEATGTGLSDWQSRTTEPILPLGPDVIPVALDVDRDWLNARIRERLGMMVEAGALDEVRAWQKAGHSPDLPAAKALGRREFEAHLDGALPLEAALEEAAIQTRRYAKRQRTWLRSRMGHWRNLPVGDGVSTAELVEAILGNCG